MRSLLMIDSVSGSYVKRTLIGWKMNSACTASMYLNLNYSVRSTAQKMSLIVIVSFKRVLLKYTGNTVV
jgi:hypothetical protein